MEFVDTSAGGVASRVWDFGETAVARGATVTYKWSKPGFYTVTLEVTGASGSSTAEVSFLVEAAKPAGTCVADSRTICLRDSRFQVRADWFLADGRGGDGSVVHGGTNDSGMFWFFSRNNWEVLVKVLDGCAVNGNSWVFAAATTDLGFRITVTDTVTGMVKEYRNEPGLPAPARTDTTAFSTACR